MLVQTQVEYMEQDFLFDEAHAITTRQFDQAIIVMMI
jgi:hypothetical protein